MCTYCTLKDGAHSRQWITLDMNESTQLRFCSFNCLVDWTAEQDEVGSVRITAA